MGGRDRAGRGGRATIRGSFGQGAKNHRDLPVSVESIYRVCQALQTTGQHFNSQKMGLDLRFFLREEGGEKTSFTFDCVDRTYVQEHLDQNGECGWALSRQVRDDLHLILNIYLFLDEDDKEATVSLGLGFPEDQVHSHTQDIICSSKNGGIPHKKLAEAVGNGICTAIMGAGATGLLATIRQGLVDEFYRVYTEKLGLKEAPASGVDGHDKWVSPAL